MKSRAITALIATGVTLGVTSISFGQYGPARGVFQQSRSTFTLVNIAPCGGEVQAEFEETNERGPFVSDVASAHECAVAGAGAQASQDSIIGNMFVIASGAAASGANSVVPAAATAVADSLLEVAISVEARRHFSLRGDILASGGQFAGAEVVLVSPFGDFVARHIVSPGPNGETIVASFNDDGFLEPGIYVLRIEGFSSLDGFVPPEAGGFGSYVVSFNLPPNCPGDWNRNGLLNSYDVLAYLNDYNLVLHGLEPVYGNPDLEGPIGALNTADVLAYLNLFADGCDG